MCWSSALSPHPGRVAGHSGFCWKSSTFDDALTHLSNVCRFIVFNVPERIEFPSLSTSSLGGSVFPPTCFFFSWVFFNFLILVSVRAGSFWEEIDKINCHYQRLWWPICGNVHCSIIVKTVDYVGTRTSHTFTWWHSIGQLTVTVAVPQNNPAAAANWTRTARARLWRSGLAWLWGVSIFPNDNNLSLVRADGESSAHRPRCGSFLKLT